MKKEIKIRNKYTKIPVFQGGMGIGISLGGLAGAVAKEGGVGTISASQIGYQEPDFYTNTWEANKRAIHKEMKKARSIAPDGIIAFNVMVAMNGYEETVREIVKTGADLIVSGAGLPVKLPEYTMDSDTAIAPIVSSEKSAKVILKYWDKKYHCTADAVVIEGPFAGGHLGFSMKELEAYKMNKYDYDIEITKILSVVKSYEEKYDRKIPVVVGGGITSNEDYQRIRALGADGIQIASKLIPTIECDAHENYKKAYIRCKKEDICIIKSPVGMPGRAMRNHFLEEVASKGRLKPEKCLRCIHTCDPATTPYCITDRLIRSAKGDIDEGLLFCGAEIFKERNILTTKQVLNSFGEF